MSKGDHILVVDDNAINRKLVAALLAHEGYRMSQAADGAEGLAVAKADVPRLVISDILMPSMDGYEFVRRLRADPATAGILVIFYTANYHEREARSLASQCGVSRVMVKPCPAPVLIQTVAEVLAGGVVEATAPPEASFDVEHLRLLTDKLSEHADALRATNSRLAALTDLNLQMASEHDPRELLASVCTHARTLLGARFGVLAVTDKQRPDGLTACVSGMPSKPVTGITDPRADAGILGKVFRERAPLRMASQDGTTLDLGLPGAFSDVRSAIAVPVCSLTRTYGWLCLGEKLGADAFTSEDERLLTILGAQLGRIYENGSLYREVQEQATRLLVEIEERTRTAEMLRVSEERFRELAENIQDVFFVSDPALKETLYVSPGYERVWGKPLTSVLDRDNSWLEDVHPADREQVKAELQRILQAFPAEGHFEFRIQRPDATVRWVITRLFPVLDARGTVVRAVGVTRDITGRKLAELRIVRLNRMHAVLSGINSLIVRATDRDALLRDACRLAVEKGGFRVAWCSLLEGASRTLRPTVFAGDADDLAASVSIDIDAHGGRSLVADAVQSGQPRYCNDLARDDAASLYREQFLARGYRSIVALPLVVAGQAAGCLVMLADTTDYFDDEEMRLLVELAEDISFALDHIGKAERLDYLARFDALTGLANRRVFEERLGQYVGMAAHTRARFAVVIADPERFEALNNSLGRANGDELLRQMAARLAAAADGEEVCGHLGSDQFATIISGSVDGSGINGLLEKLWRRWLGAPFQVGGQSIELSVRAGVALYPADGRTADALLANAMAALRNAKDSGKSVGFYTRHLSERFAERLALEKDLRRALEKDEFELHYQPKVDLAKRRTMGLEALLRWRRPGHGLVLPGVIMPLLEETGMIVEIGAWAMRRACLDRGRWLQRSMAAPRIAVNVSAVQLRRDNFVRVVDEELRRAGKEPGLDIEVTESVLMDDVEENLIKLAALRDYGVGVALDDFGTGYSSLAYLAKLPVNVLKIDRSFVAAMLDDPSVMTLVSTIITLSRSLKLETVAEGVESEEQAKILRLLGCDQMQGYLVSKPLPFDAITAFLENNG